MGANKPLKFELSYRDADIKFGQNDMDFQAEYMAQIRILYDHDEPEYEKLNLETKELFFDEVPFLFGMDLKIKDKLMYPKLRSFQMAERDLYGRRDFPYRNTIGLSS